jgi:hypothetical protein
MSGENELFDGIQILSPAEVEAQHGIEEPAAETTDGEDTSPVVPEAGSEESGEAVVVPVERTSSSAIENEEDENSNSTTPPAEGTTRYQALIKDLVNEEIFEGHSEEEMEEMLKDADAGTIKKLMELTLDTKLKAKQDSWMNGFDGAKKRFLEIEDKFTDTDTAIQMAQRLEFFDNVTEQTLKDDVNLQKNLYFEYLRGKNFSDEEARGMVEEADGIDKLLEKAQSSLPALKQQAATFVSNSEAQKLKDRKAYTEQQQKQFQSLMDSVDSKEAFVPGLKINKTIKDKVKKNMTTPVYKTEDGRELTSLMYKQQRAPGEFQALMSYYDTLGLFDVDKEGSFAPNIDKLKQIAKTKAVTELDKVLQTEEQRGIGRQNSNTPSGRSAGILDILERGRGK